MERAQGREGQGRRKSEGERGREVREVERGR
jgi:hypothetical protein